MSLPPPGEPGETPEQRQARYNAAAAAHLRANPSSANRDPDFDINVAFNTMNKRLGELVNSGKMSLDQARAAQSEMRALQLNPAAANRQAATDIFQRHLQVGKYHPENVAAAQRAAERAAQQPQGGLTLAQPAQGVGGTGQSFNPVTAPPSPPRPPEEIMVTPYQRMPEIVTPPPPMPQGVGGMELPVANTGGNIAPRTVPHDYDPAAQYRDFGQQLLGLVKSGAMTVEQANALKAPVFNAVKLGNSAEGYQQMQNALGAASQPVRNALVAGGQQMGGQNMGQSVNPVTPPPMAYPGGTPNFNERTGLYTPDNQGLSGFMSRFGNLLNKGPGRSIGYRAFDEGVGGGVMPMQGVGMAPQMPMPPQAAVSPPASAPQGMAMGGLLRKYYGGGMC